VAKEVGVKIAKGILYVLSRVLILVIVGVLVYIAFQASMNTMNVNMIVKDAMALRAETILIPEEDGSDREMMNKLFTQRAQQLDTMLNENAYANFDIFNFYHRTDIDSHIVWPWMDRVTLTATDMVMDITGEYIQAGQEQQKEEDVGAVSTEQNDDDPKPPKWPNGVYEINLVHQNGSWKINSLTLIEQVDNPVQTVTPDASATPGAGESAPGSTGSEETPADVSSGETGAAEIN